MYDSNKTLDPSVVTKIEEMKAWVKMWLRLTWVSIGAMWICFFLNQKTLIWLFAFLAVLFIVLESVQAARFLHRLGEEIRKL